MIRFFLESAVCYALWSFGLRMFGAERMKDFAVFCLFMSLLVLASRFSGWVDLKLRKEPTPDADV